MKIKLFTISAILFADISYCSGLSIKTIKSDFKQTVINEKKSKITYKGSMIATAEKNLALWKYNSPIHKKIYYTGEGKLIMVEPELEQVVFAKLTKIPNVLKLLSSAKEIAPNKLKTHYNGIDYIIKKNREKIKSINYKDEMGNSVLIEFNNEEVNKNIDGKVFAYTIPKGYDVLEQN